MSQRKQTRPRCYFRCGQVAHKGSRFCSMRCAAEYAEAIVEGNDELWCPTCREWVYAHSGDLQCGHDGDAAKETA